MTTTHQFSYEQYQRHNRRRQEHLASLRLDLSKRTVLEVGAGIGDHTGFFVDRFCAVTATEGRAENLRVLAERHPGVKTCVFDWDYPPTRHDLQVHDIVYAYGVLYHLHNPARALELMGQLCGEMLLLETCVSYGSQPVLHVVEEDKAVATQALHGIGCRPTRAWIFRELQRHFPHVYMTATQPWHEEFPTDWTSPPSGPESLVRAVFVASRTALQNALLMGRVVDRQKRV